jgi:hypothetical protein
VREIQTINILPKKMKVPGSFQRNIPQLSVWIVNALFICWRHIGEDNLYVEENLNMIGGLLLFTSINFYFFIIFFILKEKKTWISAVILFFLNPVVELGLNHFLERNS